MFGELELYFDVGKYIVSRVSQYDVIRRDWVFKFLSVDIVDVKSCFLDFKGLKLFLGDIVDVSFL